MSDKKLYMILCNDGVFNKKDKNCFSREELEEVFKDWNYSGERMEDVDGNEITIDMLIENDFYEEVYCDSMVEMGDEFVSLNIVEVLK